MRNIFFIIGECLMIFISVFLASWICLKTESFVFDQWLVFKIILITFICQVCLYYNDLYDLKVTDSFIELAIRLFQALGAASIFFAGIYIIFPVTMIGQRIFIISIIIIILFVVSWRFFYTLILNRGIFNEKIILIGSGILAQKIIKEIKDKKDCGYTISLVIHDEPEDTHFTAGKNIGAIKFKRGYEGLCEISKTLNIKNIVVTMKERRETLPIRELLNCRVKGMAVIEGSSFYEMLTGKLIVRQINPAWFIFSDGFHKSHARRFLKRILDLVLSLILLILLSPVIVITAILIKIDSKGPVMFAQERVGENRKTYLVHKFRSMIVDAEKQSGPTWAMNDDERITRVGRLIRKWRVDEIPQLWNVIKGDMSFVGPRPEREFFVKKLDDVIPYFSERFNVKPGITGWAQVCYGYGASVEDAVEKLNYDLFYIKNMSIFMDLMIILRTIKIVLFAKGAR